VRFFEKKSVNVIFFVTDYLYLF